MYLRMVVLSLLEGVALLDALLVVAPPVGHADDAGAAEDEEDEEHVQVEAGVEGRRQHEVVLRPQLVAVPVRPVHDHEPADEPRQVPRRHVAVEDRQPAEEDGRVPQVELGPREQTVQPVDHRRQRRPDQERERDRPPLLLREEFGRPLLLFIGDGEIPSLVEN